MEGAAAAAAAALEEAEGLLKARNDGVLLAEQQVQERWWSSLFAAGHRWWGGVRQRSRARRAARREWWTEWCAGVCLSWSERFTAVRGWWRSKCPLSRVWSLQRLAFIGFLENAANIAVMAILTLNIYSATYFLVWAPDDGICVLGSDNKFLGSDNKFPDNVKKTMKLITVGLPFATCPLTLYIAGQAKALQHDRRGLGCVAMMVIAEFIYIMLLGALMTVCMSRASYIAVGIVTGVLILVLVVIWGCCCYHPKWVRCCTVWSCWCHEIDVEAAEPDDQ